MAQTTESKPAKKKVDPFDPETAAEQGYFGHSPDDTPRENYSLQTPPDAPTPETTARNEWAKEHATQKNR